VIPTKPVAVNWSRRVKSLNGLTSESTTGIVGSTGQIRPLGGEGGLMRRLIISLVLAMAALALASVPVAAADGPCCYSGSTISLQG
jgi:hypothetical protein